MSRRKAAVITLTRMRTEPPTRTAVASLPPAAAGVRSPLPHPAALETRTGAVVRSPARKPFWLWFHLLSLDAPLVALVWQDWWSRSVGMPLPGSQRMILGLGVWMIYLADRLADTARGLPNDSATARHRFARVGRTPLLVLTALCGAVLMILTPWVLRAGQFGGGLALLAAAGAYFWLIHRRSSQSWTARLPKEAVVGGMFALGTAFFALCRPSIPAGRFVAAVALFGGVCFLNCALITSWERNVCDQRDPFSLLNAFPRLSAHGLRSLCWCLAGMAGVAGLAMHTTIFLPVALGALALGTLGHWHRRIAPDALRSLADAVLLTPWICRGVLAMIHWACFHVPST